MKLTNLSIYKPVTDGFFEKASDDQKKKMKKVMDEWKAGTLKDSHGKIITDQQQAIAVALSESGQNVEKAEVSEDELNFEKALNELDKFVKVNR